jgi:next to BRCA1 gene 1 protein
MLNVDTKNPSSVTTLASATRSNVVEGGVEPGQTAVFTVLLKAPEREGRSISYWRLKTPDAIAFGHKLWVDITVTSATVDVAAQKEPEVVETVKEEVIGEGVNDEEVKTEESSTMVFPKLDKESPVSSVHDLAAPAAQAAASVKAEEELVEELDSLDFEDADETDDGFLTDEEYDILDASDEDLLMEAPNAGKR